jgi:hypothetical protein
MLEFMLEFGWNWSYRGRHQIPCYAFCKGRLYGGEDCTNLGYGIIYKRFKSSANGNLWVIIESQHPV